MIGPGRGAGRRARFAPPSVFPGLVVAAALAAATTTVPGCGQPEKAASPPARSAALQPVAPLGDVRGALVFEWRGGTAVPGAIYRVSVFDTAERLLHTWDTRSTRVNPPQDLDQYFKNGGSFLWKVGELDRDGEPAFETPLTRFTIDSPPGHRDPGFF